MRRRGPCSYARDMVNLLDRPQVEAFCGLSKSSLYRLMALGQFPRPVRIGQRAVRWREEDLAKWLQARPLTGDRSSERGAA